MKSMIEKLLYAIRVANDNIIVLNDKLDIMMESLSLEASDISDPEEL